jgi:glycosyltransferase 2 family protein
LPVGVPRKRVLLAGILGLSILIYTIRQADLRKLAENFQDIHLLWGPLVLLTSALSYLCIAAVLHSLLRSMGHNLPFASSFRISLVACTMNYFVTIGGLSGVAAKVYLLAREKIPPSNTLSISMVHGFLTNTVAVVFIYLGFFFLYSEYKLSTREKEVGVIILLIAFLLSWITIQTIIHESFRKKLWQFCLRVVLFVLRKAHHPQWLHQERAQTFFENFNNSLNIIMKNVSILLAPALYALLDWLLMFFCLKCSFLAVRYPVDNMTLLVGFSVGIFMTLFSLTPASIGVMEGSMAACFYFMGLDYDRALLATLIYRFAYFFLPIIISLYFYKQFFARPPTEIELDDNQGTQNGETVKSER